MAKALITGPHGFIALHLAEKLKSLGIETLGLKREFLLDLEGLKKTISELKPDYIFHTAAYGNMSNQKEDTLIIATNIFGLVNLGLSLKDIPLKAFINFGSSSEYGKYSIPMIEELPTKPETFYGASKVSATALARAFAIQYNLPIVTVRPFSVYGPGEAEFRFIPQVVKHLKERTEMTVDIYGVHDWIYIDDLVSGVIKTMENIDSLKGEIVNIGTGRETSNLEIINLLEDLAGDFLSMKSQSNQRPFDSPIWRDGSQVLRKLGWKPKISLSSGLQKCWEYYGK